MRWLLLFVVALTCGCSTTFNGNQPPARYRELPVTRAVARVMSSGGCWVDIYFTDGSKMWVDADRRVCDLAK